jgi:FecR protein
MTYRALTRSASLVLLCLLVFSARPSFADSGHVRIIRLSLVQGDVRFTRDVKGDSLASQNAVWEAGELNLPIRQGYALATDKGRAEVEFESGAMAFLGADTVIEFFDLSNADGAKTTRLILRQGTASFYVNPGNGDYFSVTGGDFTVEAAGRSEFRLDNFDDASTVSVAKGRVSVLRKNKAATEVAKGQALTMHVGEENSVSITQLPGSDDFDRWVSGRIDATSAAIASAQQYTGTSYYTSGLADLYTYGAWYPVAGYGNCWRPYGVGGGWVPFAGGAWYSDPYWGLSFVGNQPWGWLPYHYGGWIFDPFYGWLWSPGSFFYGGPGYVNAVWNPSNGVFVRSRPGFVGVVPVHPLDAKGKTPINLARGVFPVSGGAIGTSVVPANASERWKIVKNVPSGTVSTSVVARSAMPQRVSRTVVGGASSGPQSVTLGRNSSITYDASARRFVNTNSAAASTARASQVTAATRGGSPAASSLATTGAGRVTPTAPTRASVPAAAPTRASVPAARSIAPPPAARSSAGAGAGGGRNWGGGQASSSSSGSRGWSGASPSAASSGARSSGGASAPATSGRPH